MLDRQQQRLALRSWGISPELLDLQNVIDSLLVRESVNDLGWLRSKRLGKLSIGFDGPSLAGLEQLRGLTTLTLSLFGSSITSLAGLERLRGLTTLTLNLCGSIMTSLAGLEQLMGLTTLTLNLGENLSITSLAGLEQLRGLTTLTLSLFSSNIHTPSLAGLGAVEASHDALHSSTWVKLQTSRAWRGWSSWKGLTTLTLQAGWLKRSRAWRSWSS